jgi:hypothetical protein
MSRRKAQTKAILRRLLERHIVPGLRLSREVADLKRTVGHFEDDAFAKGALDAVAGEFGLALSPPPSWAQGQLRVQLNDNMEEGLLALILTKRFSRALAAKLKRREIGTDEVPDSVVEAICRDLLKLDSDGNPLGGDWDRWAEQVLLAPIVRFDEAFGCYKYPTRSKIVGRTIQLNLPAIALGARRSATSSAGGAAATLLHEMTHAAHDAVSWEVHGIGLTRHRECLKEGIAELASNILADRVSVGVDMAEVCRARDALNRLPFAKEYTAWRLHTDADDCPLLRDIPFAKAVLRSLAAATPGSEVDDVLFLTHSAEGLDAVLLSDAFVSNPIVRSMKPASDAIPLVKWSAIRLAHLANAGHADWVKEVLSTANAALQDCSSCQDVLRWVDELEWASRGQSFQPN